jgi:hypothetical protein
VRADSKRRLLINQVELLGNVGGTVVGATGTAIGTGIDNTNSIISLCPTGNAASIAADYSLNGFSDWYLPSKEELEQLQAQKAVVRGFANAGYWSSSDFANQGLNYVHITDFSGGTWDPLGNGVVPTEIYKAAVLPVRAIRTFGAR